MLNSTFDQSQRNVQIPSDFLCNLKSRLSNEKNRALQRLQNDVTVLVFKRIIQLTGITLPESHSFVRCCNWYHTSPDVSHRNEISIEIIRQKLQEIILELQKLMPISGQLLPDACEDDVLWLVEHIISTILPGQIPYVTSEEILSRFLWILYARIAELPYEEMICHNTIITIDAFKQMVQNMVTLNKFTFHWKGYVKDGAILAKNKTEIERGLPLSDSIGEYTSSYVSNLRQEGHAATIGLIKRTLQRAIDMICYVDKGNGDNSYFVRSQDVRWFCSLFDNDKGSILIEMPKLTTPQITIYYCIEHMINYGIHRKSSFREDDLQGKRIICYDGIKRINGSVNTPIFVSKGITTCQRYNHILANVTAIVQTVDKKKTVSIPVQKCLICNPNRYFVSQTTLDLYENQNGVLYFRRLDDLEKYFHDPYLWMCTSSESLLHKLGYNVAANNTMSSSQRQLLLKKIINERQLQKQDIMKHIDMLIHQHKSDYRYNQAVEKWRADYIFLAKWKDTDEIFFGHLHR